LQFLQNIHPRRSLFFVNLHVFPLPRQDIVQHANIFLAETEVFFQMFGDQKGIVHGSS